MPQPVTSMGSADSIRSGLGKFIQYVRGDFRRTFSVEHQRSELGKLAKLCRVPPVGTLVFCCLMLGAFVVQSQTGVLRAIQLYGTLRTASMVLTNTPAPAAPSDRK
jgi:hypothetical protein